MPVDGALKAPLFTADVTNTRSRQTIGDDQPRPGTSATQATFSVVDHRMGRAADVSATPFPPGPRNWGQLLESAAPDGRAAAATAVSRTRGRYLMGSGAGTFWITRRGAASSAALMSRLSSTFLGAPWRATWIIARPSCSVVVTDPGNNVLITGYSRPSAA